MSGKVSGHGMLAVTFRHQRELTGKNQTPMGHTEQRTNHARHHELLERAGVRDSPVVLLFGWWKERHVKKGNQDVEPRDQEPFQGTRGSPTQCYWGQEGREGVRNEYE